MKATFKDILSHDLLPIDVFNYIIPTSPEQSETLKAYCQHHEHFLFIDVADVVVDYPKFYFSECKSLYFKIANALRGFPLRRQTYTNVRYLHQIEYGLYRRKQSVIVIWNAHLLQTRVLETLMADAKYLEQKSTKLELHQNGSIVYREEYRVHFLIVGNELTELRLQLACQNF
ncbi:MAG: hypothetical protein KME32_34195 [Mojavia pulchra JT2-VF2]|jgi:hypothetical protein|uniref:Uncharacterized protein n=1 Tax=Mojavia pulchra JT2-VF2 TaxID=287848 RepID=A0A951UJM7_9NOST|nr:hypothetical protein [Mojavia pulchra JT2-VF2]